MPMNLFKYGIALISIVIIVYFCARVITAKLKKAGILKQVRLRKKDEQSNDPDRNM